MYKSLGVFFQTRVCGSLEPKTNTVKLVVDGESIIEEVRLWCSLIHFIAFREICHCTKLSMVQPNHARPLVSIVVLVLASLVLVLVLVLVLALACIEHISDHYPGSTRSGPRCKPTSQPESHPGIHLWCSQVQVLHHFVWGRVRETWDPLFVVGSHTYSHLISRCLHAIFLGRSTQAGGQTWTYSQEPWLSGGW